MYVNGTDTSSLYSQSLLNSTQRQGNIFSKIDSSSDGSVDQSELESFTSALNEETGRSINVSEQFSDYDEDGDGAYNESELKSFMEANRPAEDELAARAELTQTGRPEGPPPPPPQGTEESDDDEESYIEELLAALEETDETSEANSYLTLFQSFQDGLFSFSEDDEENSTVSDYLANLNQSLTSAEDYVSISITA